MASRPPVSSDRFSPGRFPDRLNPSGIPPVSGSRRASCFRYIFNPIPTFLNVFLTKLFVKSQTCLVRKPCGRPLFPGRYAKSRKRKISCRRAGRKCAPPEKVIKFPKGENLSANGKTSTSGRTRRKITCVRISTSRSKRRKPKKSRRATLQSN